MKKRLPTGPENLHLLGDIDQIIHTPARLMILTYLYVVDRTDYVFLMRLTGLTWGNLFTHLTKLEEAGYIIIEKSFKGKKPFTILQLSDQGRKAFREYKKNMVQILDDLPD
jgi:DNA-binding MarR family transcriptional regulator